MLDIRLIDANAIVEKLQSYYESLSPDVYSELIRRDEISSCIAELINSTTIDAQPVKRGEMSEWIRCSERMPEANEDVLVVINPGDYQSIHIGYMYNEGDWMIDGEFWYEEGDPSITHWMPLPEPPKEVDEDGDQV